MINLCKLRGLSLFGKATIIKSFLIPKLLYVSSIIETRPEIIKQMEKMIYKFLWKGPDKVTRLSVINTLENGGLNLKVLVSFTYSFSDGGRILDAPFLM